MKQSYNLQLNRSVYKKLEALLFDPEFNQKTLEQIIDFLVEFYLINRFGTVEEFLKKKK